MKIEYKAGTLYISDVDPSLEAPIREALEPFQGLIVTDYLLSRAKSTVLEVIEQFESNPLKDYLKASR